MDLMFLWSVYARGVTSSYDRVVLVFLFFVFFIYQLPSLPSIYTKSMPPCSASSLWSLHHCSGNFLISFPLVPPLSLFFSHPLSISLSNTTHVTFSSLSSPLALRLSIPLALSPSLPNSTQWKHAGGSIPCRLLECMMSLFELFISTSSGR